MVALRLVDGKGRQIVIRSPALVCPAGIVTEGGTLSPSCFDLCARVCLSGASSDRCSLRRCPHD